MPLFAALACALIVSILMVTDARALWLPRARNFQGRDIAVAGVALVAGLFAGFSLGMIDGAPEAPAALLTVTGFGLLGALDDRYGDRSASGFRGHLRASMRGRFTTGFWKVAGGGSFALAGAWLLGRPTDGRGWAVVLLQAVVIALAANTWNLFDTRPARAVSVFLLLGIPLALFLHAPTLWIALAAAAVFLPWDRGRAAMLGDAGSNALGAAWGVAFVAGAGVPVLAVGFVLLTAFNAWSERHSLNAEIARRPWLARLDLALRGPDRKTPASTRENPA